VFEQQNTRHIFLADEEHGGHMMLLPRSYGHGRIMPKPRFGVKKKARILETRARLTSPG
jgi:hypothetical protein